MNQIKLSVCICTIPGREGSLANIISELESQISELSVKPFVEILYLGDNRHMTLGTKRRHMKNMAKGRYICFIDDDDMISHDYIAKILEQADSDVDVITFKSKVTGVYEKDKEYTAVFNLAMDGDHDDLPNRTFYRIPNHLCPIHRRCYENINHPDITYGEDAAIVPLVKAACTTQARIDSILYHYRYDEAGTSCPPPNR